MMTTTIGLWLEPLDVLFFRDGRPFTGAERSISGFPLPQTVAGAVRTALLQAAGCDFARLGDAMNQGLGFATAVSRACAPAHRWIGDLTVRGPWLARRRSGREDTEVLVPTPAILHRDKRNRNNLYRLSPLRDGELPDWNSSVSQNMRRPLWLRHLPATEAVSGYLTRRGLERFLAGDQVAAEDVVESGELFDLDYRVGIGISPDRLVAEESQIYGRGFLAMKQDVCLYVELEVPEDASKDALLDQIRAIHLGGEGRYAIVHRLKNAYSWPRSDARGGKSRPLILLTTPGTFEAGWRPRVLEGRIVSAAVPGSVAFSGWDFARGGPKPTRFAVSAGSVYFLDSMPDEWTGSLAECDEERRQGWGCCLKGVWTDE